MQRQYLGRRGSLLVLCLAAATLVLAGCSSVQASQPPSSPGAAGAPSEQQDSSRAGQAASGKTANQTRKNEGGRVTVSATWKGEEAEGPLTFSIVMDTHSIDLDGYNLKELAALRNELGQEVKPESWDAPEGGHHRSGLLVFPRNDESGEAIDGAEAKAIELVIRDVAGVKERVLRWEIL